MGGLSSMLDMATGGLYSGVMGGGGGMSGMISGAIRQAASQVVAPGVAEKKRLEEEARKREEELRRVRGGRESTMVTGPLGLGASPGGVAYQSLLGG